MRIRTLGVTAALAAALFTGACTSKDAAPDNNATSQPDGNRSRKAVTDMTVVKSYLESARKILGGKFTITVVPAGETHTCDDRAVVDGGSEGMVVCDDRKKLVVPTEVQYAFGGYNRHYVTYRLVLPATEAMSNVYTTETMRACAAAFITAKQVGPSSKTAGDVTRALDDELSGDEEQATHKGMHLALNNDPVENCAR